VACVPKQHLTGAFVFGEVAAEKAVKFVSDSPEVKLNRDRVGAFEERRNRLFGNAGRDIDVRDLEYKARRLIGDYVISPKNEYKLLRWTEWAERFTREIETQVIVRDGHELSKIYEVEHIIQCATLSARASLERKESRWGGAHRRTDYPETDNKNWLCHVILRHGEHLQDIQVSTRPIAEMEGKGVRS